MTYPVAVEHIHGAAPETVNRSVHVPCANDCGKRAQVLVRWESHTGRADEWLCVACAKTSGAVA